MTDEAKLAHEETPDEGHTFRITVTSRGASKVVGEEHNTDANWWSDPWTIEVREFSLAAALRKAARVPFATWAESVEVRSGVPLQQYLTQLDNAEEEE